MHLHSFCFVLTRLPVYISLSLNYFQNKILFSEKLQVRGDFQAKCLQGGDFAKKVEDHWSTRTPLNLCVIELNVNYQRSS